MPSWRCAGTLFQKPLTLWALFPAPAPGTTAVSLRVPGFGQLVDLPLS
ncbi:MAG TPA: hypothetical protein VFL94_07415 [Actinomycetales bacterium]|nr:hypothetical protein [Actinomycetales bacterium]